MQKKWCSLLNYLASSHLSFSPFKGFASLWPLPTIWFLRIELSGWVVLSYLPSVYKPGAPCYLVSLRDKSSENQSLHSTVKVSEQEMGLCFLPINTYLAQTNMFCLWTENNGSKAGARNDSWANMLTLRTCAKGKFPPGMCWWRQGWFQRESDRRVGSRYDQ